MALTKENLIDSIYNQCGLSKGKSIELVQSLLEIIKSTLASQRRGCPNHWVREILCERKKETEGEEPSDRRRFDCWDRGGWCLLNARTS